MERGDFGAHVSPTERTVPNDSERTLASPRFDEKSIQRARPAVPLTLRGRARAWPFGIIFACVLAGLAGGLLGGFALMKYQGSRSDAERPASSKPTVGDAQPVESDARPADGQQEDAVRQEATSQESRGDGQAAAVQAHDGSSQTADAESVAESGSEEKDAGQGTRAELRAALDGWVAATNARDVGRQMDYYAPSLEAFYLARNASRASVREEKSRLFSEARAVDVRASEPEIRMSGDGRTAVMRFRKRYKIDERGGEVLQELRWRHTPAGWRIVGERDLRVIQ